MVYYQHSQRGHIKNGIVYGDILNQIENKIMGCDFKNCK